MGWSRIRLIWTLPVGSVGGVWSHLTGTEGSDLRLWERKKQVSESLSKVQVLKITVGWGGVSLIDAVIQITSRVSLVAV